MQYELEESGDLVRSDFLRTNSGLDFFPTNVQLSAINDHAQIVDHRVSDHQGWPLQALLMNAPGDIQEIRLAGDNGSSRALRAYDINNCGQITAEVGAEYDGSLHLLTPSLTAFVFNPNPVVTSGNPTLAGTPGTNEIPINRERQCVKLLGLDTDPNTNEEGCLKGEFVEEALLRNTVAATCDNAFVYDYARTETGFDATNVYYHADGAIRYAEELIPDLKEFEQIDFSIGLPHNGIGSRAFFYHPDGGEGAGSLGFVNAVAAGKIDASEDAEVVWHEAAHAIFFQLNENFDNHLSISRSLGEQRSLGEGLADFYAATAFLDVSPNSEHNIAFNSALAEWDARGESVLNGQIGLRQLESLVPRTYPEAYIEDSIGSDGEVVPYSHQNGEIIAEALWKVYLELKAAGVSDARDVVNKAMLRAVGGMQVEEGLIGFAERFRNHLSEDIDQYARAAAGDVLVRYGLIPNLRSVQDLPLEVASGGVITGSVELEHRAPRTSMSVAVEIYMPIGRLK